MLLGNLVCHPPASSPIVLNRLQEASEWKDSGADRLLAVPDKGPKARGILSRSKTPPPDFVSPPGICLALFPRLSKLRTRPPLYVDTFLTLCESND
jgi:hypothetical protein